MSHRLSVVVPAHNESTIIARTLTRMIEGDGNEELEVIVVANGCTDDTAAVAAAVSDRIRVIEIAEASKIAGLNAGDAAATTFPRAFVDADVDVTAGTLLALADGLAPGTGHLVASPRLDVDTRASSWPVRAYYRMWEATDYRRAGHIGSGVYAMSEVGRARFGLFPSVIADDLFVQTRFDLAERLTLTDESFAVAAPRHFRALLHRATRISLGNLQLSKSDLAPPSSGANGVARLARLAAGDPSYWIPFIVYCVGYGIPRRRARRLWRRGAYGGWNRDETTRVHS